MSSWPPTMPRRPDGLDDGVLVADTLDGMVTAYGLPMEEVGSVGG